VWTQRQAAVEALHEGDAAAMTFVMASLAPVVGLKLAMEYAQKAFA